MEIFKTLSNPFEGDYAAVTAELATNQFRVFCRRAARLAEQHGYSQDPRLTDISRRLAQRGAHTAYWMSAVSVIFKGLSKQTFTEGDWNWLRTQIAIGAHVTGVTPELELDVETNAPLVVAGQLVPAGRLSIRGGPDRMTIQAEGATAPRSFSVIAQRNASPVWAEDDQASSFVRVDGQPAIRVVNADWHTAFQDELSQPAAVLTPEAVAQFEEALELMGRGMPEYRAWVLCLLKEITPIRRPEKNMIASGSSPHRFGGIDLCVPATPTETAEMMIHECTHQYFHMASWLGSFVTAEARPHYSPLKKCERPLDRILIGYHAFGNALIAFEKFREMGLQKETANRRNTIAAYMDQLRVPIENEVGLSELGLAFSRPLRARLTAIGV
jgi:HEXXH motif-containing protein